MNFTANKIVAQKVEKKQEKESAKSKPIAKPPKRHSNFFLTINTQKNINSMNPEEVDKLKKNFDEALDEFFNIKIKELIKLSGSKTGDKYGWRSDAPYEELEKRIEGVKIDYAVEIGPESGKLHSHAMICFSKRACDTKLDYNGIREYFSKKLGFDIYMKNIVYTDANANIKSYIEKNPVN